MVCVFQGLPLPQQRKMRLREVEFHISGSTAAGRGNPELFPLPCHVYNCPMAAFTDRDTRVLVYSLTGQQSVRSSTQTRYVP